MNYVISLQVAKDPKGKLAVCSYLEDLDCQTMRYIQSPYMVKNLPKTILQTFNKIVSHITANEQKKLLMSRLKLL